jgi:hypothetical protein
MTNFFFVSFQIVLLIYLNLEKMEEYHIEDRKSIPAIGFYPRQTITTGVS